MTIRILLVEDQSFARQGLRIFLGLDLDLEVIVRLPLGPRGCASRVNFGPRWS